MLPDSSIDPPRARINPFAFADSGLPEMFRAMEEMGPVRRRVRCCLAGGAAMVASPSGFDIGKRNYWALKRALRPLGVFDDRNDVGGTESLSVWLELETGEVD